MFVDLAGKLQVLGAARLMTVCLHTGDGFLHGSVVGQIEFEGFLFRAFGSVSPVAFRCFLHTVHIRVLSPAYPDFLEVAASFPVVQGIDGEYLLPLDGSQSQDGGNVLVAVLELGLVEQYLHIGVVDDGFLHDGRIYHIVQLLGNDTRYAVELSYRFVQIFDVFRHGGRSNRLPRFLNNQRLASFLDAHLLQEHVHDNQDNYRKKHGVIFNLVNLEDDELLIEEVHIQIGVQGHLQFAAPVELLQDSCEVTDVELNLLLCHDLRNAFQCKLIVGIE